MGRATGAELGGAIALVTGRAESAAKPELGRVMGAEAEPGRGIAAGGAGALGGGAAGGADGGGGGAAGGSSNAGRGGANATGGGDDGAFSTCRCRGTLFPSGVGWG